MSPRFIIKLSLILAGVYNLLLAVQSLGNFISSVIQYGWSSMSSQVFASSLYIVVICFFLIFKSDAIIQLMRLDKQFAESSISFKMDQFEGLLKILLVLFGLKLSLSACPHILAELIYLIREDNMADAAMNNDQSYKWLMQSIFELLLGLVLLLNYSRISKWLFKQNQLGDAD